MRTLLNESLPPHCSSEQTFSSPESVAPKPRTFLQNAVLDSRVDLVEVGLDGTVIATPSAMDAEQAYPALERGRATSAMPDSNTCPELTEPQEAARVV
jgi:hypothetical protein